MYQKVIVKTHTGISIKKIIILCILILCGCVAQPKPKEIGAPKDMKPPPVKIKPPAFEIKDVAVEPRIFNPTKGERVVITYSLSQRGKAIIKVFDPAMRLIRDLPCKRSDPGVNKVIWDGRDQRGKIVPDEAYFFTIEALNYQGKFTFYDTTTISGGEYINPRIDFNSENKNITYELPKDARLMIRAGITGGALLKTIVNWSPRLAGKHHEPWDGKDSTGAIDIVNQKGFKIMAEAVTLPDNSLIAHGNADYTYYEYKTMIAPDRPKKRERPLFRGRNALMGRQRAGPRELVPEPKFSIQLPEDTKIHENGLPIVQGKIPLKIVLDQKQKRIITEQRYEIIAFVDFKFITEEEGGYSPFTWMWDTRKATNGEHIVTINVLTLKGGKSTHSIKVMVENEGIFEKQGI